MTPLIRIRLLGPPQIEIDDEPSRDFKTRKAWALLAYLVRQAQPIPRTVLADLFWGDKPEAHGRRSLSTELNQLTRRLPDAFEADRQTVQFAAPDKYWLDTQTFENRVQDRALEDDRLKYLAQAVELYRADFMAGLFLDDCYEFELWLTQERESWREQMARTLERLAIGYSDREEFEIGLPYAQRWVKLNPLHEAAQRTLMVLYERAGQRAAALRQYEHCVQVLQQELGVPPAQETTDLYQRLQHRSAETGQRIADRYRLERRPENLLGQGAMGMVYRGIDVETGDPVAIKILNADLITKQPNLVTRFEREGEALRRLNHPNIVSWLASSHQDQSHYLVMDFVSGGSLADLLRQVGPLPKSRVIDFGLELTDALTRAHHLNIIHRDLKPANVLVANDGSLRLTDFGVAQIRDGANLTQTGAVIGTVDYLSPEACQGEPLDGRSDIWSLGILLLELLTGQKPFSGDSVVSTLTAIVTQPLPDIGVTYPDLPPGLAELLSRMLVKDPAQRLSSIRQVGVELEALKAEKPLSPATPVSQSRQTIDAKSANVIKVSTPFQALTPPPHFVGRRTILAQLQANLTEKRSQVYALVGMGGVGKTTLAAQVGHLARANFSDGVLWANAATSSSLDILGAWAQAYEYDFSALSDLASRAAAVRGVLAEKETLIIIDNVLGVSKIKPLLPNSEQSVVLLTTRDLDVAHALNAEVFAVGELSAENGRALLAHILGEERVTAEEHAAEEICELLHNLPLAIEIVAQQLKSRPRRRLLQMAVRLHDEHHRLGLEISDQAVRTSFEVSWASLNEDLQMTFSCLAVFAGRSFSIDALAAIAEIDLFDAEDYLDGLLALSLVNEADQERYQQHPLLADFAAEKLTESEIVYQRMADYYYAFSKENKQNYDLLEPEWGNIMAAIQVAYGQMNWSLVVKFTNTLAKTWLTRARFSEARQAYSWAQEAALQLADKTLQAANLLRWGEVCLDQDDNDEANRLLNESLDRYYRLEDGAGIADAQYHLARIALNRSHYEQATSYLAECLSIREELEDKPGIAAALYRQARVHFENGPNYELAEQLAKDALAIQEPIGDNAGLVQTLRLLTQISGERNNDALAQAYGERTLQICEELQDPGELAASLYALIPVDVAQKRFTRALDYAERSLTLFRQMGNRRVEAMILHQISQIYRETEKYEAAQELAVKSLTVFQTLGDNLGCAYALRNLGDIWQKLGQAAQARDAWQQARLITQSLNHSLLQQSIDKRLDETG